MTVDPSFPQLRLGPSGPLASVSSSSGGGTFAPYDNTLYYDPAYSGGDDNGSIGAPFSLWGDLMAAVGEDTWKLYFPGKIITPSADALPLTDLNTLVLEGIRATEGNGSVIDDTITVSPIAEEATHLAFRYLDVADLVLNGGPYMVEFENCLVGDVSNDAGSFTGLVVGTNTEFQIDQNLPEATLRATGGNVLGLIYQTIYLTDLYAGAVDGSESAVIECTGTLISCKGVTFVPGTIIEFSGAEGTLLLDGPSYKSFLDNDIQLTNGHVVRDDGSWPIDAITYQGLPDMPINFAKNPRAILELDSGLTANFLPPLTREVQILIVQDEIGGHLIGWPTNVHWSDGLEPDWDTTPGSVTLVRLDYEEAADTYYGWVALMNAEEPPP